LLTLLADFDPAAVEFIATNQPALQPLLADAWPEWEKLVHNYAFAEAEARLTRALENFPTP
jgi:hypothetical protein